MGRAKWQVTGHTWQLFGQILTSYWAHVTSVNRLGAKLSFHFSSIWERKENGRRENGEERKWERKCYPSSCLDGWGKIERKENGWVRWDMVIGQCCATFLSLIIPHFGRKNLGGKWGMWPTHFSSPLFFPLPFSPHPSKGKYFPHPIFLSHFLSSPIFPPSKHTLNLKWLMICGIDPYDG